MIKATDCNNRIKIEFEGFIKKEDFTSIISRIKSINGHRFHGTESPKYWSIPLTEKPTLVKLFPDAFLIDESFNLSKPNVSISVDFTSSMKIKPFNFQVIGINFLIEKKKCILGDTMGLGKTVQVLGAAYKLFLEKKIERVLIISPSSLKYQWADEIIKFLPTDSYIVIDKTPAKREAAYTAIKDNKILFTIINYELARIDIERLLEFKWDVICNDECHRIKNEKSKTYKSIMLLESEYKWAATGTPVQNRPDELFNIFSWVNPSVLGNRWIFRNKYFNIGTKFGKKNMILGYKNLDQLHYIIKPHYIRRLTKEVAPELPDLTISNRYIEMTEQQERLHSRIADETFELIVKTGDYNETDEHGNVTKKHPQTDLIKGLYTMMQVVADAPELLKLSESKMAQKYAVQINDFSSPKLNELYDIVEEYLDEDPDNKIVIFSKFEKIQMLIVERLKRLTKIVLVSGKLNPSQKHDNISLFKTQKDIRVLIASDAMNYGANCQEASLVIQVDLPYNPAVYHQRNGRIHRIGTKHSILNVINLISLNSIDEKIYDILIRKEALSNTIIESKDIQDDVFSLDIAKKLFARK